MNADLALGARGADVKTVNEYLGRFGYFPNADLAREFPAWRPIVTVAPADTSTFDAQTQDAVSRLQANSGLPITGVVDQATRDLLKQERCGVPDGITSLAPDDKYFVNGISPSSGPWSLSGGLSSTAFLAGGSWIGDAEVGFNFGTASPHVTVQLGSLPGGVLGTTSGSGGNSVTITLSNAVSWTTGTPSGSQYHQTSALVHHLGHAMGLNHSASMTATMRPVFPPIGTIDTTIDNDDRQGISAAWDRFETVFGGLALDIAGGEDGSIWVIGTNPLTGGHGVWKFNGSGWTPDVTQHGAVRIAVQSNGIPVMIDDQGLILARLSTDPNVGGLTQIGNASARGIDIGAGGNSLWMIASNNHVSKLVNGTWTQDATGFSGLKISVSPTGKPWMISGAGGVYRRNSTDPTSGSWEQLPGSNLVDVALGLGADPLVNDSTAAFVTNTSGQLWAWSEQTASGSGELAVPGIKNWHIAGNNRISGTASPSGFGAKFVAVSSQGKPWATGTGDAIYRATK